MLTFQYWFLPKALKSKSKESQIRTKFLAVNASASVVWGSLIVPMVLFFDSPLSALLITIGALFSLLAAFIVKYYDNILLATRIYIGGLFCMMVILTMVNGGTNFGGIAWIIMLPILATDSLSERAGLITLVACITLLLGLKLAESLGIVFPTETTLEGQEYFRFISLVIITGMIWTIGSAYSKLTHSALRKERELSDAKTKFIANVSHELRTPLNGIIGMLEVIKQQPVDESLSEDLDTIQYSSQHLLKLVNEILDLTKTHSVGKNAINESYDIKNNIRNIIFSLSTLADAKQIKLKANINPDIPDTLFGDSTKVDQLIMNFLSNAIKFTAKGSVTLTLDFHLSKNNQAELLFKIEDTGIGISQKDMLYLFDPFYQVDDSYSREQVGSGLGLAISKSIIESLGGHVVVTSKLGEGSVFSFNIYQNIIDETLLNQASNNTINVLKTKNLTIEKLNTPSLIANSIPDTKMKVLIVEDNPINQMILKRMLEYKGYSVKVAENGMSAIDKIQQYQFSAIFMDIQMPLMDGLECTKKIRQELKNDLPIIAVTASASIEDREEYLKIGINDVIHKPVVLKELYQKLAIWLPTETHCHNLT